MKNLNEGFGLKTKIVKFFVCLLAHKVKLKRQIFVGELQDSKKFGFYLKKKFSKFFKNEVFFLQIEKLLISK